MKIAQGLQVLQVCWQQVGRVWQEEHWIRQPWVRAWALAIASCQYVGSHQGVGIPYLVHHTDHKTLLLDVVGANSLFILENLALA
jgi:hypothetical protein